MDVNISELKKKVEEAENDVHDHSKNLKKYFEKMNNFDEEVFNSLQKNLQDAKNRLISLQGILNFPFSYSLFILRFSNFFLPCFTF
jgi:predicted  nucleic acid-binding Zn-ribbon protein